MTWEGNTIHSAQEMFELLEQTIATVENSATSEETMTADQVEALDQFVMHLKGLLPPNIQELLLSEWPKHSFILKKLSAFEALCYVIGSECNAVELEVETISKTILCFTVDGMRDLQKKWRIPASGWHLFRELMFESMFYIGEDTLQSKGFDAFLDLGALEFLNLFTPLILHFSQDDLEFWLSQIQPDVVKVKKASRDMF